MSKPADLKIPLFEFFSALRRFDRQSLGRQGLGTEEFLVLLDQLAQGYGQLSEADLYSLCKILWFKPYHSEKVFRSLFDKYMSETIHRIRKEQIRQEKAQNEQEEITEIEKPSEVREEDHPPASDPVPPKQEEKEKKALKQPEKATKQKEKPVAEAQPKPQFKNVYLDLEAMGGMPLAAPMDAQGVPEHLIQRIYQKRYRLQGTYFPLKSRMMHQSFQMLREIVRGERKTIVDWEATIDDVARQGFFKDLVRKASPEIRTNLHILVDHEGSMIAFEALTQHMVRALQKYTGREPQVHYFRNCPADLLYANQTHTQGIRLDQFLERSIRAVMIVSDAGAARGDFSRERILQTRAFIEKMNKLPVVWLNPMPRDRWIHTSADYIHGFVPMYELSPEGIVNAIKALKLKHRRR